MVQGAGFTETLQQAFSTDSRSRRFVPERIRMKMKIQTKNKNKSKNKKLITQSPIK
jgi:hypothetical protein